MKSWLNPRKSCDILRNYKLSVDAENDLIRIHQYGVIKHGEVKADSSGRILHQKQLSIQNRKTALNKRLIITYNKITS